MIYNGVLSLDSRSSQQRVVARALKAYGGPGPGVTQSIYNPSTENLSTTIPCHSEGGYNYNATTTTTETSEQTTTTTVHDTLIVTATATLNGTENVEFSSMLGAHATLSTTSQTQ